MLKKKPGTLFLTTCLILTTVSALGKIYNYPKVFELTQILKIQPKGDTMLKRQLGTLFLVTCLILTTVPAVLGGQSTQMVTVAGDGSGDYNCDGKDDHVQINQALEYAANNPGTTVHLKGPFTYDIGDSLMIGSNTVS